MLTCSLITSSRSRRRDLRDPGCSAFPSFVYGESERGHVLHGERTSDVDFSSLLRLPLDQVALVRLQLCETLGEIKRRASARLQKRIFKHIVLLDLYNMPLTKLTISAAARKIVGQILEVQSMCVVWLEALFSSFFRVSFPAALSSPSFLLLFYRYHNVISCESFSPFDLLPLTYAWPRDRSAGTDVGTRKEPIKCGSSTPHRSSFARTRC